MVKYFTQKKYIRKPSKLISPLLFDLKNNFYYEFRKYNFFLQFVNDENDFKPTIDELHFLIDYVDINSKKINEDEINKYDIQVLPLFYNAIINLQKIPILFDPITNNIKAILQNYKNFPSISISKIKNLYYEKFSQNISRTKIHRILKNKFHFVFRKTILKPKVLENLLYKKMSFLFIKSMLRALKLKFDFVFLDETNFKLQNMNYKMWRNPNDFCHYGLINKNKINFLLAVGKNNIINYKMTSKNINSFLFTKFFSETIDKIPKDKLISTIFVMDNLSSHLTKEVKNLIKSKSLKVFYTVPYESIFNPIELCFRAIKNITYKNLYKNIKELKKDIINIIESNKLKITLFKNFLETLSKYLLFIQKNKNINLNNS